MKNKIIAFAGCKDTTLECLRGFLESDNKVDWLLTIDQARGRKNKVSGYYDLSTFAKKQGIKVHKCDTYSLKSAKDKKKLAKIGIDLLLVVGWQRLIPKWLLDSLSVGAFGMHGASQPLPYGRGRSPMNWSLIQGKRKFITNLFKYNEGVDAGEIVDTQSFDLNRFDTGKTVHYKNTLAMVKLLEKNIDGILSGNISFREQLPVRPSYYPKRTADDGVIFWDRGTEEIYNLIRAVTRPFPGAVTFYGKTRLIIWKAQPFDTRLFGSYVLPGTVLKVFESGDFVVKTGTDSMLVTDYQAKGRVKIMQGERLNSNKYTYNNPFDYPVELSQQPKKGK